MSHQRGKEAMFLVCFCRASGFAGKAWDVCVCVMEEADRELIIKEIYRSF